MKGGLKKVDSTSQLLSNLKNAGNTAYNTNMKEVGTALEAKVAVNINASGNGSGLIGFGGKGGAGVAGAAAIGYGDGVKGSLSGTGDTQVSLGVQDAVVDEGLTKEEVGKVIHAHMKEIRYCYENTTLRQGKVDGKVSVAFIINGKGRVSNRSIASTTIEEGSLGECIMRKLTAWQFPLPRGGVDVNISYPFIFKTLGGNN
jgi:hypothetical protein